MAWKLHRQSLTLGLLAAALALGSIPASLRGEHRQPVAQDPDRLVLIEQFTSTR